MTARRGRPHLIVRVETDTPGLHGLGCASDPRRTLAVRSVLDDHVAPLPAGRDPEDIEEIHRLPLNSTYRQGGSITGNALGGVDVALRDLEAERLGLRDAAVIKPPVLDVFPGTITARDGGLRPDRAPGRGVDSDEAAARKYPVPEPQTHDRWALPRNTDGSVQRPGPIRIGRPSSSAAAGRATRPVEATDLFLPFLREHGFDVVTSEHASTSTSTPTCWPRPTWSCSAGPWARSPPSRPRAWPTRSGPAPASPAGTAASSTRSAATRDYQLHDRRPVHHAPAAASSTTGRPGVADHPIVAGIEPTSPCTPSSTTSTRPDERGAGDHDLPVDPDDPWTQAW